MSCATGIYKSLQIAPVWKDRFVSVWVNCVAAVLTADKNQPPAPSSTTSVVHEPAKKKLKLQYLLQRPRFERVSEEDMTTIIFKGYVPRNTAKTRNGALVNGRQLTITILQARSVQTTF